MKTQFKNPKFFIALVVLGLAFNVNLQAAALTDHGSDTTKMARKKMDKMGNDKMKMDEKMGKDKMKTAEKAGKDKMKKDKMNMAKDSSKMKM